MSEMEDKLAEYMTKQDEARLQHVLRVLAAMTKRERQLVWEIAVMASTQGQMRGGGVRQPPPPDSSVVRQAVLGCLYMEDLYPTFARLDRIATRRARKAEEAEVPVTDPE